VRARLSLGRLAQEGQCLSRPAESVQCLGCALQHTRVIGTQSHYSLPQRQCIVGMSGMEFGFRQCLQHPGVVTCQRMGLAQWCQRLSVSAEAL